MALKNLLEMVGINIHQPKQQTIDPILKQDSEILEGKHQKQQGPTNKLPINYVPGGKIPTNKVTQPGVSVFGDNRPPVK